MAAERGRRHAGEEAGCGPNCSSHLPIYQRRGNQEARAVRSEIKLRSTKTTMCARQAATYSSDGTSHPDEQQAVPHSAHEHGADMGTSGREGNLASPHRRTRPFPPPSRPTQQTPRDERIRRRSASFASLGHFALQGRHVSSRVQLLGQGRLCCVSGRRASELGSSLACWQLLPSRVGFRSPSLHHHPH